MGSKLRKIRLSNVDPLFKQDSLTAHAASPRKAKHLVSDVTVN